MEEIRDLARREGGPMSAIVNELLAEGLLRRRMWSPREFNLPAFDMGRPAANLADRDALASLLEG